MSVGAAGVDRQGAADAGESACLVHVPVEQPATTVGRTAFAAGIALTELRTADGAGLEEMFLELTAESQRDHLEGEAA